MPRPVPEEDADRMLAPLPSGRHGLPREHIVRSQRARLVRAAIDIAGTGGYAAMTVTAVTGRAGVSRKTFYEQFADREDCFLAAYEMVAAQGLDGMRAAFAHEGSWPERLRAALRWALEALAIRPAEARLAFVEVLSAGPRALARRDRALADLHALFAPGFAAAPDGAAIPRSMPVATAGALYELIGVQVRKGDGARLLELLPELLFCSLAPFLGPRAAAELCAREPAASPARSD